VSAPRSPPVVFERWITPWDTDADLLGIARLN
jgi:hypothetical protein